MHARGNEGPEDFSHLEILFRLHLTDPTDVSLGARHPDDNTDRPEIGIFTIWPRGREGFPTRPVWVTWPVSCATLWLMLDRT